MRSNICNLPKFKSRVDLNISKRETLLKKILKLSGELAETWKSEDKKEIQGAKDKLVEACAS